MYTIVWLYYRHIPLCKVQTIVFLWNGYDIDTLRPIVIVPLLWHRMYHTHLLIHAEYDDTILIHYYQYVLVRQKKMSYLKSKKQMWLHYWSPPVNKVHVIIQTYSELFPIIL